MKEPRASVRSANAQERHLSGTRRIAPADGLAPFARGDKLDEPSQAHSVTAPSSVRHHAAPESIGWAMDAVDRLQGDGDRELIEGVRRGDEDAFRRLFNRYASTAKALAQRVLGDPYLAAEVVQETFTVVWRDANAYGDEGGSVKSWLMAMVHHRAIDLVRREEVHRRGAGISIPQSIEVQRDLADEVVHANDFSAERRTVDDVLADLPMAQRLVLELMYLDGLSQSSIAEKTGIPLGTVKSRTLLGMRRMRSSIERTLR